MNIHRISCAVVASLLGLSMFTARTASADEWELTIAPYIWITSFDGKIGLRNQKEEIDASFEDILDASDSLLAFNADVRFHYGRFGLLFSPSYMQMGVDDVANGTVLEADFTTDLLFLDMGAEYRVADWTMETKNGEETKATVDVLAGARYTKLKTELDFDDGTLGSPDRDKDWWDPIVGAEANIDLCPRWFAQLHGDVGGFGTSSDFATNAMATVGWRFNVWRINGAIRAGYRVFYEDYDTSGFDWRMTIHGPILGLMTTWG